MRRRALLRRAALAGLMASGLEPRRLMAAAANPGPVALMPPPLRPGSRVVALAPGMGVAADDPLRTLLAKRCAERGWTLSWPAQTSGSWRWFSAPDRQRRDALQQAWGDPDVAAVFCVGGGWGSARVLEEGLRIPARPRWCVGFSDCSAILLAQWAAGSSGAIHGSCGAGPEDWQRLVDLLEGRPVAPLQGRALQGGVAEGPLVVSNLTIATSLIGTPWLPDLKGAILVLEDTGEAPYRIDRQLTQWRSSGLLRGVAGIGLGRFSWARDDVLPGDFSMEEILLERLAPLGVPLVRDLPVGHGRPNVPLPLGRSARLDGSRGDLILR